MGNTSQHAKVCVDKQGRVVLPAALRHALSIEPGEELIAIVKDGRLVLEKPDAILDRLQAWFSAVPPEVSLADELIAQRRQEALSGLDRNGAQYLPNRITSKR